MNVDAIDWPRVMRLTLLSPDQLLTDLAGLRDLAVAAAPEGVLTSRWAHSLVADVSVLDRLYHVGLIHLWPDPPCCATPRKREYYSIHEWARIR